MRADNQHFIDELSQIYLESFCCVFIKQWISFYFFQLVSPAFVFLPSILLIYFCLFKYLTICYIKAFEQSKKCEFHSCKNLFGSNILPFSPSSHPSLLALFHPNSCPFLGVINHSILGAVCVSWSLE